MKRYFFSDLHGDKELFDKILNFIDDNNDEVQLYFLGDAADRGVDGYHIMKTMLNNPETFIYIKGNHEDMFVAAAREYLQICEEEGYTPTEFAKRWEYNVHDIMYCGMDMRLHAMNGGAPTFLSWLMDGCPRKIINTLDRLPLHWRISMEEAGEEKVIYDLCHAGCLVEEWVNKDRDAMLWDRNHFFQPWTHKDLEDDPQHILVHGHPAVRSLPTSLLKQANSKMTTWKPVLYNEGTKLDLDTRTIETGVITLVELRTHKMVHFAKESSPYNAIIKSLN